MTQTTTITQNDQVSLPQTLIQLINGLWVSQAIYIVAKLNIADLLKDGAKSSDELAKLADVDADSLYRVLRTLAGIGIFTEGKNQRFELNPLAKYLQTDTPGSLRSLATFLGEPWYLQIWEDSFYSVKTGKSALDKLHGTDFHSFVAQDPEKTRIYNEAMTSLTSSLIPKVLASYDFSHYSKIVDIGGGQGILISEILKNNPNLKGILFDQPHVVEEARTFLEAKGVAERCEFVGGNFYESLPSGADIYLMKHIIHIPNIELTRDVLKNCYEVMTKDAKLVLLEGVVPPPNQSSFTKWLDLNMLVVSSGGRERTEEEYRELLAKAGFKVTKVIYTQAPVDIIEAVKV